MPPNRRQTIELARAIEERSDALRRELHQDAARAREESYGETAGAVPDTGDQSIADVAADTTHAELDRDLIELRELDAARRRLAEGSYGLCVDCGADIDLERLRAWPGAARCIDCQRRHEATFRTR
jgi:DnaK suppressor protein